MSETIPPEPRTPAELYETVRELFEITVAPQPLCDAHDGPAEYLRASFFDQSDLLVWANRGGGKTLLAAVATLLDAIYHGPLVATILGGSFDQSDRMAAYIRQFGLMRPDLLEGKLTRERVRLAGGSEIRVLAQSQRAVRGLHVQKIRCDEVDLFDREVWEAVQFSTRSSDRARGSIEVLSTLHRAGGLMDTLVQDARGPDASENAGQAAPADTSDAESTVPAGYRLVTWCLWDVIERCGPQRRCDACMLADDCAGRARGASGFFRIDDAIAIKARSSRAAWDAEMLCKGVKRDWVVFREFSRSEHVGPVTYEPDWPTFRAIDFGYRSPLVCLWIQLSPAGRVHVIDEYVRRQLPIGQHARAILARDPGPVRATFVDPAGRQRESTSGHACTDLLAAAGIPCTWRAGSISRGVELIREALSPASGPSRLTIAPTCRTLIDSFQRYHYPAPGSGADPEKPVKDGPDHAIDALRYFFLNRMQPGARVRSRGY